MATGRRFPHLGTGLGASQCQYSPCTRVTRGKHSQLVCTGRVRGSSLHTRLPFGLSHFQEGLLYGLQLISHGRAPSCCSLWIVSIRGGTMRCAAGRRRNNWGGYPSNRMEMRLDRARAPVRSFVAPVQLSGRPQPSIWLENDRCLLLWGDEHHTKLIRASEFKWPGEPQAANPHEIQAKQGQGIYDNGQPQAATRSRVLRVSSDAAHKAKPPNRDQRAHVRSTRQPGALHASARFRWLAAGRRRAGLAAMTTQADIS